MPSDEDKSTALSKLLTMASRSVGTFDHILNLARDVTTGTEVSVKSRVAKCSCALNLVPLYYKLIEYWAHAEFPYLRRSLH